MLDPNVLSQAIANAWERIALSLASEREQFEYELTPLMRRLESGPEHSTTAAQRILSLFARVPETNAILLLELKKVGPPSTKGRLNQVYQPKKERYTVVPVLFGTDRSRSPDSADKVSYGPGRGALVYGLAEVSIPDDHRMGGVERPRWWKLQFREDPQKHIVIQSAREMPPAAFTNLARGTLERGSKREVLIFIHGYNVGFDDAIARTAQIAYDLHFEGLVAAYSWPSEGAVPSYTVDETNVTWSRPHFAEFLEVIRKQLGAQIVHIIAHSMGNRLLTETVAQLTPPTSEIAKLRQIVFAAPDMDAATFKDMAAKFLGQAERFTLYASSQDKALKVSRTVHGYTRAGESGLDLVVVSTVDTIDATEVDTSLLGHSYYGDCRSVLSDMFYLIREGTAPSSRFGLSSKTRYGTPYWIFQRSR